MLRHFGDFNILDGYFKSEMASETWQPGVSWIFDEARVGLRGSLSGSTLP